MGGRGGENERDKRLSSSATRFLRYCNKETSRMLDPVFSERGNNYKLFLYVNQL